VPWRYTGTVSDHALADAMQTAARALLATVPDGGPDGGPDAARRDFDDEAARHWIEYRPRPRPGISLVDLDIPGRKAAHRLLATALSEPAYAQAVSIFALEEVLDRQEGWRRGRHSADYRVVVFGEPGDDRWAWRFEGHHLSVTMTIADGRVSPAPIFLGANPARVGHGPRTVLRPLAAEEDLARDLVLSLRPADRSAAVVADQAPDDIRTATHPAAGPRIEPAGIARSALRPGDRALLDQLVALHLGRLPEELADAEDRRLAGGELHLAWEGPLTPGVRHYYRIQADDLLIEYDNTSDDGNHAHTVLRRPLGDFGADVLAAHRAGPSHRG
jgi:hypothetical protein